MTVYGTLARGTLGWPSLPMGKLVVGIVAAQALVLGLLVVADSPWRILAAVVALAGGALTIVQPRFGFYVLAASLIGQWPGNAARYTGICVGLATIIWVLRHRLPLVPRSALLALSGLYVAFVMTSTIMPLSRTDMLSGAVSAVSHVGFVWLCLVFIDSPRAAFSVVVVMMLSGIVTALVGLVQWWTHFAWPASTLVIGATYSINVGKSIVEWHGWMGYFRIDSITGTSDYLGVTMQTIMPFMLCWALRQRRAPAALLGYAGVVLLGVVNLLSFTRGTWIITPIVLLLTVWLVDRRQLPGFAAAMIVAAGAVLVWPPVWERVLTLLELGRDQAGEYNAVGWRVHVLPIAFQMMLERPIFGVGVGQQSFHWTEAARDLVSLNMPELAPPVHNSYLLAGIELGVGGLAVSLALVGVSLTRLRQLARRFHEVGEHELSAYTGAAFAAVLGLGLAMVGYPLLGSFRYFWLLVGFTAALVRLERTLRGWRQSSGDRGEPSPAVGVR